MEKHVLALKTLGHTERLRILALLSRGELTVSELVQILKLSQPRVTQYIISLETAGVIERLKEGSWVFSRIRRGNEAVSALVATTLATLPQNDPILLSDLKALENVRAERSKAAEAFFANVANDRSQLGDDYLPQADIEAKMQELLGAGPFEYMVDMGTGTGRMLEVFSDRITRGSGIDNNSQMLKVARSKLAAKEHIAVRQGDILSVPLGDAVSDLVSLHQVLHYLDDPEAAITEAARLLKPAGQLIIVDYEDHEREEFRTDYAHRRLGFSDRDIREWLASAGLSLTHSDQIATQDNLPNVRIWIGTLVKKSRLEA